MIFYMWFRYLIFAVLLVERIFVIFKIDVTILELVTGWVQYTFFLIQTATASSVSDLTIYFVIIYILAN